MPRLIIRELYLVIHQIPELIVELCTFVMLFLLLLKQIRVICWQSISHLRIIFNDARTAKQVFTNKTGARNLALIVVS